jgi:hypothetical protein
LEAVHTCCFHDLHLFAEACEIRRENRRSNFDLQNSPPKAVNSAVNSEQWTVNSKPLSTIHCSLPCSLFTIHCSLFTALFTVHCAIHCSLHCPLPFAPRFHQGTSLRGRVRAE